MPKMKTKKAVVKRFRKTASGKVKCSGAGRSHLLINKSRKRKRNLRKGGVLAPADQKRIAVLF